MRRQPLVGEVPPAQRANCPCHRLDRLGTRRAREGSFVANHRSRTTLIERLDAFTKRQRICAHAYVHIESRHCKGAATVGARQAVTLQDPRLRWRLLNVMSRCRSSVRRAKAAHGCEEYTTSSQVKSRVKMSSPSSRWNHSVISAHSLSPLLAAGAHSIGFRRVVCCLCILEHLT